MARILFTADLEEGNIFATFGLAKQLLSHGHHVVYVGVSDAEPLIRNEGFGFYPLLQSSYPEGSKYSTGSFMSTAESRGALCKLLVENGGELDSMMKAFNPDVIFVPPYLSLESLLLHLRFGARMVHLRSAYIIDRREEAIARYCNEIFDGAGHADGVVDFLAQHGIAAKDTTSVVERIANFPEFVTLPEGYEQEGPPPTGTFYIGASLDTVRKEQSFDWHLVPPGKRLIFCTLGSQSHRDSAKSNIFFHSVLKAIADIDDVFLVIAVGKSNDIDKFHVPANTLIVHWAPQLAMLSRAQMMIMHGGMGTTRECIFRNVPMLVHPLMRDQFASAEAICRHGLGLRADVGVASVIDLRDRIDTLLEDKNIRTNLSAMRNRFIASDQKFLGVQTVEDLLSFSQ